jgi:signal transduction histidine kinase
MLNLLYQFLILVGATIAVVVAYLWWQARAASQINVALIRLNEELQFDAPALLQQAWPLLEQSGLRGLRWKIDWFGVVIEGEEGEAKTIAPHLVMSHRIHHIQNKRRVSEIINQKITIGEMKLSLDFYQNHRGEKRYFDSALIETFLLLLRSDMSIKAVAIDTTLAQMSRLTLFLQHDMKNVAQFIQLMADQLAAVPPGKELQVLDYLRTAAPLMRHRADRIVQTLKIGQTQTEPAKLVHLNTLCEELCRLYQLNFDINGAAHVPISRNNLEAALENILKNYNDIHLREGGSKPLVKITINDGLETIEILISSEDTPAIIQIERLFEPFWSLNPEGLGIGLYQAKHLLESCNASLSASKTGSGSLQFQIKIMK